jgi:hypothetical protein
MFLTHPKECIEREERHTTKRRKRKNKEYKNTQRSDSKSHRHVL